MADREPIAHAPSDSPVLDMSQESDAKCDERFSAVFAAAFGYEVAPTDAPCCPECESYTNNGCGGIWHDTASNDVPWGCPLHGWDLCGLCDYVTKRRVKDDPRA